MRNLLEEQEGEALVHGAEIGAPMTRRPRGTAEPWARPICNWDKNGILNGKFVRVNENEHCLSEEVYQGRIEQWLLHGLC